jgi:hypothetical protein
MSTLSVVILVVSVVALVCIGIILAATWEP